MTNQAKKKNNQKNGNNTNLITVIIPTLNAEETLNATLKRLSGLDRETIVCDGGSTDKTREVAQLHSAIVIETTPGRGGQLKTGAKAAHGTWLLFLHADTYLSDDAIPIIQQFINKPENGRRAAYFRFRLNDDTPKAKQLERQVAWRCKTFALPYGDQGFLINRSFYEEIGGFKDIPLMEDVDLVWRIEKLLGKQALVELSAEAITSAQKFHRDGYFKRSARNLFCLFLFWINIPPWLIVKLYR